MATRARTWGPLAGLLILTAAIYAPALSHGLVYEDVNWMTEQDTVIAHYPVPGRAVTMRSFQALGSDLRGQHAVNLALHLVNGLLVYAVALRMVPAAALAAAAVFLLHPLSGSAVLYITGRADLLMTGGVLLAAWLSLQAFRWWRAGLIAGALLLAAASKEIGAVGMLLVAVTAYRRGPGWRVIVASPAFTVMVSIAAIVSGAMLGRIWTHRASWIWMTPETGGSPLDWLTFLPLQSGALWHLLTLVIWPVGFSIDHDVLAIAASGRLVSLALTAVALVAFVRWRSWPLAAWVFAWVAISVAPRFVFRTSEFITEVQLYLAIDRKSVV